MTLADLFRQYAANTVGLFLLAASMTGCSGTDETDWARRGFSESPASVAEHIILRLDTLECLDENDATGTDDEVSVYTSWAGTEEGRSRLPADGSQWRMCGSNDFQPAELAYLSIEPGEPLVVHIEVWEDDSLAERVGNQIDDTLAHFSLEFALDPEGTLGLVATPLSIQDNNAVALLPLVELDLDEVAQTIGFRSVYRNADGGVHYEGGLSWQRGR